MFISSQQEVKFYCDLFFWWLKNCLIFLLAFVEFSLWCNLVWEHATPQVFEISVGLHSVELWRYWNHNEPAFHNQSRTWMGLHAKGHYKAEEHSRRAARASVQLRGLYDAVYVSFWLLDFHMLEVCITWIWFTFHFLKSINRTIYNMCTQKPPHDYSQQLYDKYREAFEEYITTTVRVAAVLILISL